MAATPKGIYYPDSNTNADFVAIFSTLASSVDSALGDFTYDSGWINVSDSELSGGWENYNTSSNQFSYRRVGKWVACKGRLRRGTPGATFFTLPVGFRPPGLMYFTAERNANLSATVNLQVFPSGAMESRSSGSDSINWLPLTSIHFFTDDEI